MYYALSTPLSVLIQNREKRALRLRLLLQYLADEYLTGQDKILVEKHQAEIERYAVKVADVDENIFTPKHVSVLKKEVIPVEIEDKEMPVEVITTEEVVITSPEEEEQVIEELLEEDAKVVLVEDIDNTSEEEQEEAQEVAVETDTSMPKDNFIARWQYALSHLTEQEKAHLFTLVSDAEAKQYLKGIDAMMRTYLNILIANHRRKWEKQLQGIPPIHALYEAFKYSLADLQDSEEAYKIVLYYIRLLAQKMALVKVSSADAEALTENAEALVRHKQTLLDDIISLSIKYENMRK
jgi:hypothetical protein